jgi:hypothetical protein
VSRNRKRQVQHIEIVDDRAERPDADPDELDRANLRLLDHLLFAAQLHRGIHLDRQPSIGRLFQLLAHVLDRLHGRIAFGVHVRRFQDALLLRQCRASRRNAAHRERARQGQ